MPEPTLPAPWEPIQSAPTMFTLNGIGTTIFDGDTVDERGRVTSGTLCLMVILPIFALRHYLYTRQGKNYRFYASAPISGGWAIYNMCVMMAFFAAMTLFMLTVFFPGLFTPPEPPPPPAETRKSVPPELYMISEAEAAVKKKDWVAAVSYAGLALEEPASKRRALEILGTAHLARKQFDKAKEDYTRLLKMDPKNPAYRSGLQAAQKKGKPAS